MHRKSNYFQIKLSSKVDNYGKLIILCEKDFMILTISQTQLIFQNMWPQQTCEQSLHSREMFLSYKCGPYIGQQYLKFLEWDLGYIWSMSIVLCQL